MPPETQAATPTATPTAPPIATPITPAATTPAGNSPAPAAATAAPWWGDVADPEIKGFLELKKPTDAVALAKMYREAEKFVGVPADQILRIPKQDAPKEEWDAFYDKGGRPKTPEDYKLEVPMGDNGEFAKFAAGLFHEAGVPVRMAAFINQKWNEKMASSLEQTEQQQKAQSQADMLNLQREWGNSYGPRREMARRMLVEAATAAGISPEENNNELLKLENYIGNSAKLTKVFAMIAEKTKYGQEANFHDGSAPASFNGMTPDAAKVRKEELMSNPDWAKRYHSGDKAAIAELDALQRIQNSKAA